MIRALWFLIKAGAFLGALAWLTSRPGDIRIEWLGYVIETTVGFAIATIVIIFFVWSLIYRFWRSIIDLPGIYRRYAVSRNREKGYRDVTLGLVAVAAGDARAAGSYLKRAQNEVPDAPLTKLLAAQTALLDGETPKARRIFTDLLENGDAAFFGIRGLLTQALRDGDIGEALSLARRAGELQPKRLWILRTLYDLETRNGHWEAARVIIKKGAKRGVFNKAEAAQAIQAVYTAEAMMHRDSGDIRTARKLAEKAFVIDPTFAPAVQLLAEVAMKDDRQKLAIKAIEKSWQTSPHPDLGSIWMSLAPQEKDKNKHLQGAANYRWALKLADKNAQHRESHRLTGRIALENGLWREARLALTAASDYRRLAQLEIEEKRDSVAAHEWLARASLDMHDDPQWVCTACGHAERIWQPHCQHCGLFNTQIWMIPTSDMHRRPPQSLADFSTDIVAPPLWDLN